jgi:hypothetical protein
MAIIHNPDSEYSREMAKWNTQKRHGGLNANGYEPFPRWCIKRLPVRTARSCAAIPLAAVGDAVGEAFARSCQQIVQRQEELDKAVKQGWYDTPDLAWRNMKTRRSRWRKCGHAALCGSAHGRRGDSRSQDGG